jgi:hypothetical protein
MLGSARADLFLDAVTNATRAVGGVGQSGTDATKTSGREETESTGTDGAAVL